MSGLTTAFHVLGTVGVTVDGEPVPLGGQQRTALLAMLLLHANRVVSAKRLAEVLWDDRQPRTAQSALHVRVSQLRRALSDAHAGDDRLLHRPPGYLLRVDAGELDLQRFTELADRGREALSAGDAEQAAGLLGEALALFRGQPFEDVTAPALDEQRDRLRQRRLAARTDRIEADLRLGRHAAVVDELVALAGEHPHDEGLRGRLMLALHRCGRRGDALATYRDLRQTMAGQLGLEPGEELQRLHKAILTADPSLSLTAVPVAAPAMTPAQLPADHPHFTGRAQSLRHLDALLPGRAAPVVISAIAGLPGVGKTTLAVHWAHRVRTRFPDGQLYVNLRGFDPVAPPVTPSDALRVLLDGLGVAPQRIPFRLDAQAGLYRSLLTGKRMLILLDNAHDAEQVRPLLPATPGSLAVITSRNQLTGLVAIDGADVLALDVLSPAEAREMLAGRVGADRVAAEPEAADEIVKRCAGLPLALSVAGARAAADPRLALADLAAELRDSELDALTVGDAASDVRAVFSSSYRILDAGAQRLIRLLGIHPGPDITVPAAASLAGGTLAEAGRDLQELCRAAFVTETEPGRYTMHDLVRAYAVEMAGRDDAEPDRQAAVVRTTDHYLHTVCAAAHLLVPHGDRSDPGEPDSGVRPEALTDSTAAKAWFAQEQAVLLGVFRAAAAAGLDRQVTEFAWALARFFDLRSRYHDMAATQRVALAAAERLDDLARQARAHRLIGLAASREARYDEARDHLTRALEMNRELGDHVAQGHTAMTLGQLHARTGSYELALAHAEAAYAAFQAGGQRYGQANALNSVGWYHAQLGHYDQTLIHCTRAVELARELGDTRSAAAAWDSLAYAHLRRDDRRQAADCYRRAVELFAEHGDHYFEADTLLHLADALDPHEQTGEAIAAAERALELLEALGHADAARAREKLQALTADL
ncbi:AfsR/SARP family transcriptional regulator [Actinoplanes palleronii]|uniref:SARP family transcriptional regulator n=1 Tax=Actinoplanes palleronii TaxID=113570 RepID=A0ABQ4BLX3_9ACTN|nr:BTAD domain-containing putative transcriptional regulator [Actinoplanes palleronii]GIE71679.1 SARP family transcriptional regulator [Actinoplanes palleronii]